MTSDTQPPLGLMLIVTAILAAGCVGATLAPRPSIELQTQRPPPATEPANHEELPLFPGASSQ